jgi:hypothetical protein
MECVIICHIVDMSICHDVDKINNLAPTLEKVQPGLRPPGPPCPSAPWPTRPPACAWHVCPHAMHHAPHRRRCRRKEVPAETLNPDAQTLKP